MSQSLSFSRRRALLATLGGTLLTLPFPALLGRRVTAAGPSGGARRVIFFYFPDGVPDPGGAPAFHASGNDTQVTLSRVLGPLANLQNACIFLNGLSMGPADAGSHPGGAKKLLTAMDGGHGESIDRFLARTAGASSPVGHLYLGALATANNASGDKYISYLGPETTVPPEDDPRRAFQRLFGKSLPSSSPSAASNAGDDDERSVLDVVKADLQDLRGALGPTEKSKLDFHFEALRDLEKRLQGPVATSVEPPAACGSSPGSVASVQDGFFGDPAQFPNILRAQTDLMVQAMACGLTKVGVLQCSQHTSELIMSRFPDTEMFRPGSDMRSHQASHYGQPQDPKFNDYVAQRRWYIQQFTYLLEQLQARKEGEGTMLDYSMVLLCSEVSDGNTHSHDNMPFVLAGRGGGALRTGRVMRHDGRRHGDLYAAMAQAMGQRIPTFGQDGSGPLPGLLV